MGQILSLALDALARSFGQKELRVLMLGLDAAGKTTVLYKLKLGEKVTTIPTIGFNVETVRYKNVNFTVWDVGGQHRIRQLWSYYYDGTQALIFVVDSSDRERILEARDELHDLINNPSLVDVTLLVLANKCDLPHSMNVGELTEKLQLPVFKRTPWYIQSCCGTSGEGLYEGLNWLSSAVNKAQ